MNWAAPEKSRIPTFILWLSLKNHEMVGLESSLKAGHSGNSSALALGDPGRVLLFQACARERLFWRSACPVSSV